MACLEIRCIVIYVDDFFIIAATEGVLILRFALLQSLSFAVNMKPHRTVLSSRICTFLGICLDPVRMEARLDDAKLASTLDILQRVMRKRAIKCRNLESMAGN